VGVVKQRAGQVERLAEIASSGTGAGTGSDTGREYGGVP
jgi:hypothetical protein